MFSNLRKFFKKHVLNHFASKLPRTHYGVSLFVDSVLDDYDFPKTLGFKRDVCTTIMHLGQSQTKIKKSQISSFLSKSVTNQVAYQMIQEFNHQEKAEKQAAAAAAMPIPTPLQLEPTETKPIPEKN